MTRTGLALARASFSFVALASAAAALAGIPDGDGIIHACFKSASTNQGALRVIDTDAGQTCGSSETPIQWQATSPDVPRISVGQAAGPGIIAGDEFNTVATVTITAPTAGHVLVTGFTTIAGLAADQVGIARLRDAVSGDVSNVQNSRMAAGGSEAVSVGWLFEVAAGERVFELGTRGEFGTIVTGSATITAIFVPD